MFSCILDFEDGTGGRVVCNISSHLFFFQRQRKIQRERLLNDFSAALNTFQKIQRQAANREREFVARVRASSRVSVRNQLYRVRARTHTQKHRMHPCVFTSFYREDNLKRALERCPSLWGSSTSCISYHLCYHQCVIISLFCHLIVLLQWFSDAGSDRGHHWRRPEADPGAGVSYQAIRGADKNQVSCRVPMGHNLSR